MSAAGSACSSGSLSRLESIHLASGGEFEWENTAEGELEVTDLVERSADNLTPCLGPMSVSFTPRVEKSEFLSMIGGDDDYGEDRVAMIRARLQVADGDWKTVDVDEANYTLLDIQAATTTLQPFRISLGWNGYFGAGVDLTLASDKAYDARVLVDMNLIHVDGEEVTEVDLIDGGELTGTVTVKAPPADCEQWGNIVQDLADGPDGTVLVDGEETLAHPSALWRQGRLRAVFGALHDFDSSRLETIQAFLDEHPALYRFTQSHQPYQLQVTKESELGDDAAIVGAVSNRVEKAGSC
jgi:hypothetical protein